MIENRYLVLTEHGVFSARKRTAPSFEDMGTEKKGGVFPLFQRAEEILLVR